MISSRILLASLFANSRPKSLFTSPRADSVALRSQGCTPMLTCLDAETMDREAEERVE
jgi:hypothetical protein